MKNRYKFLQLGTLLFAFLIGGVAYGQGRTVTGTVLDGDDNSPLPGVSILVKGTNQGTTTDIEGKFSVNVPEGADVLVFSYVGYTSQEVAIAGRSIVNVSLALDTKALSEVVVIGYGVQDKKEITSAVTNISAEDLNRGNVNDVSQLLQGKVAGLSIVRPGSNPNQGFNIRLRGLTTLGGNTEPLVVIDGVIGADLNSVDPTDIADISILKDGSAAAIYGTRGSSGVILITTKSGRPGRTTTEYNTYLAAEQVARTVQVASREQFLSEGVGATDFGSTTNWYDEITRTGLTHVHNLALGGGTEQTIYRISLNYRDVQGIAEGVGFQQFNGRVNLTQRALKDKLTMNMNLAATRRNSTFGFDEAFRYAAIYNPTAPVTTNRPQDVRYGGFFQEALFDFFNPAAMLRQNVNDGRTQRLNLNFDARYDILPELSAMVRYSVNHDNFSSGTYRSSQSFWVGADRNGLARRSNDNEFNELLEYTLNYQKSFGDLNISLLGGYSYQYYNFEGFSAEIGNFISDATTFNALGFGLDLIDPARRPEVNSYRNDYELQAFFGRVNLNYKGWLFASASLRREGTSRFGRENRYGNFPAVSLGADLTNIVEIPGFNTLKLRGSYGRTGNIPDRSAISIFRLATTGGSFFFNGSYIPNFGPAINANPNLGWEIKDEINIGFDFSALKSRLTGTVDVFDRTISDFIIDRQVPVPPNEAPTTWLNVGEVNARGLEIAMNYAAINKPTFSWSPGFNFTTIRNTLNSLSSPGLEFAAQERTNLGAPGQNETPLHFIQEGKPVGQIWGLKYMGLNPDGTYQFVDIDGVPGISNADRTVIGNGLPDFEFGINNNFTIGKFDLNIFLRGVVGHDLVNTYRAFYENPTVASSYNFVRTRFFQPELRQESQFNSYHVEDASFLRLDNMTLGYNFSLPSNSAFRSLRLYFAGQNLFYITRYTGADPEVRYEDGTELRALAPGIDRRDTWARTRTFTIGATVGF